MEETTTEEPRPRTGASRVSDFYMTLQRYKETIVCIMQLLLNCETWQLPMLIQIAEIFKGEFYNEMRHDPNFPQTFDETGVFNMMKANLTLVFVFIKLLLHVCTLDGRRSNSVTRRDLEEVIQKVETTCLEHPPEWRSHLPEFLRVKFQIAALHCGRSPRGSHGERLRTVSTGDYSSPTQCDRCLWPFNRYTPPRDHLHEHMHFSPEYSMPDSPNTPTNCLRLLGQPDERLRRFPDLKSISVFPTTPYVLPPLPSVPRRRRESPKPSSVYFRPGCYRVPLRGEMTHTYGPPTDSSDRVTFYPVFKKPVNIQALEKALQIPEHTDDVQLPVAPSNIMASSSDQSDELATELSTLYSQDVDLHAEDLEITHSDELPDNAVFGASSVDAASAASAEVPVLASTLKKSSQEAVFSAETIQSTDESPSPQLFEESAQELPSTLASEQAIQPIGASRTLSHRGVSSLVSIRTTQSSTEHKKMSFYPTFKKASLGAQEHDQQLPSTSTSENVLKLHSKLPHKPKSSPAFEETSQLSHKDKPVPFYPSFREVVQSTEKSPRTHVSRVQDKKLPSTSASKTLVKLSSAHTKSQHRVLSPSVFAETTKPSKGGEEESFFPTFLKVRQLSAKPLRTQVSHEHAAELPSISASEGMLGLAKSPKKSPQKAISSSVSGRATQFPAEPLSTQSSGTLDEDLPSTSASDKILKPISTLRKPPHKAVSSPVFGKTVGFYPTFGKMGQTSEKPRKQASDEHSQDQPSTSASEEVLELPSTLRKSPHKMASSPFFRRIPKSSKARRRLFAYSTNRNADHSRVNLPCSQVSGGYGRELLSTSASEKILELSRVPQKTPHRATSTPVFGKASQSPVILRRPKILSEDEPELPSSTASKDVQALPAKPPQKAVSLPTFGKSTGPSRSSTYFYPVFESVVQSRDDSSRALASEELEQDVPSSSASEEVLELSSALQKSSHDVASSPVFEGTVTRQPQKAVSLPAFGSSTQQPPHFSNFFLAFEGLMQSPDVPYIQLSGQHDQGLPSTSPGGSATFPIRSNKAVGHLSQPAATGRLYVGPTDTSAITASPQRSFKDVVSSPQQQQSSQHSLSLSDIEMLTSPRRVRDNSGYEVLTVPPRQGRMVRPSNEPDQQTSGDIIIPFPSPRRSNIQPRRVPLPPGFERALSPESQSPRQVPVFGHMGDEVTETFQEMIAKLSSESRYELLATVGKEMMNKNSHSFLFYYRILHIFQENCLDLLRENN